MISCRLHWQAGMCLCPTPSPPPSPQPNQQLMHGTTCMVRQGLSCQCVLHGESNIRQDIRQAIGQASPRTTIQSNACMHATTPRSSADLTKPNQTPKYTLAKRHNNPTNIIVSVQWSGKGWFHQFAAACPHPLTFVTLGQNGTVLYSIVCVLHGEDRISPATSRIQNNAHPRGQLQDAVRT